MMSGKGLVIAVDYDRYYIGKGCNEGRNESKYVTLEYYKHATNRTILGTS